MAGCTVWVAASADAEARRISRWWAKNRPAAPRLFQLELARAIEMIEAHPEIGRWAQHPRHGRVQILRPQTNRGARLLQVLSDFQRGWDRIHPSRASPAAPVMGVSPTDSSGDDLRRRGDPRASSSSSDDVTQPDRFAPHCHDEKLIPAEVNEIIAVCSEKLSVISGSLPNSRKAGWVQCIAPSTLCSAKRRQ